VALRVQEQIPVSHRARAGAKVAYRRILVPVLDREISEHAVALACRLAAERRNTVTALYVVEVPVELPLDAHMLAAEGRAKEVLAEAAAIGDLYGVSVTGKIVRGRAAGESIAAEAEAAGSEIIVLSAPRKRRGMTRAVFGTTVDAVLRHAPCRVMVAAAPARS
jgi:nucleotide-binding universal stress UspA family protein